MLNRLLAFHKLPRVRQRLLLLAFAVLCWSRYQLATASFKRIVSSLRVHAGDYRPDPLQDQDAQLAEDIGWAVRTAAARTPWRSTCLVQVLAAQRMLAAHGIAGAFYLGARSGSENTPGPGLWAHAWLKCDDRCVTGEVQHERFMPITAFSWP